MEQKLKKRKKKKEILSIDYECLVRDEILKTKAELRAILYSIMKYHIGEQNAITPYQLFVEVFGVQPEDLNIFRRKFWWDAVKAVLRELRSEEELFVVNARTKLYVLQTKQEAEVYKGQIDRDIKALAGMKEKADRWVKKQSWKGL